MVDEKSEIPRIQQTGEKLPINKDTLDIIVANIIPSSKYFEARFDHLEHRVIRIETDMKDFRSDMNKRFDDAKHDSNEHFKEIIQSINGLSANLQDRDKEQRGFTLKMFSIAFIGVLGVALKLFMA